MLFDIKRHLLTEDCWFTPRNNLFFQLWKLTSIYNLIRLKNGTKHQFTSAPLHDNAIHNVIVIHVIVIHDNVVHDFMDINVFDNYNVYHMVIYKYTLNL